MAAAAGSWHCAYHHCLEGSGIAQRASSRRPAACAGSSKRRRWQELSRKLAAEALTAAQRRRWGDVRGGAGEVRVRCMLSEELRGGAAAAEAQRREMAADGALSAGGSAEAWGEVVVGVLGGGQLGRMICEAASPLGVKVAVLDPEEQAPAAAVAFQHVRGSFRDREAVRAFAAGCGVLTVEIEHVDVEVLEELAAGGLRVEPHPATIAVIQDKYAQKRHFQAHNVPVADFMEICSTEDAEEAGRRLGFPLMLKSKRLAYDGRGNSVARRREDIAAAISALGGAERGLYVEKWAAFDKELAVIVARGRDGSMESFPVVETVHRDNICHTVMAPAAVDPKAMARAVEVARRAVGSLRGCGVFAVELFLLKDGQVLLNEVAPRPHNSGHHTIEACYTSQFEQHLRAVLGLPLGSAAMKVPAAIMVNILGEDEGEAGLRAARELMARAVAMEGASVHWYGKPGTSWNALLKPKRRRP